MRYTIIKNGIQERINYLVGTNDTDPSGTSGFSGLTEWSVQASMIANIRRLVQALVGDNTSQGRVMKGLLLTQEGTTKYINIDSGIGLTPAGNIITLNESLTHLELTGAAEGNTFYVYLRYGDGPTEDGAGGYSYYHESNIMGTTDTPKNIIYDDIISGAASTGTMKNQVTISTSTLNLSTNDGVYLGSIYIDDITGDVYTITKIKTPSTGIGLSGYSGYSGI